jgi:hypothetical protein
MNAQPERISRLRQRRLDDLRMRHLSPKTQRRYLPAVRRLAEYLGCSPVTATAEDAIRNA